MESTEEAATPIPPETSEETPVATSFPTPTENEVVEPTDEAVLSYLRKRGLGSAALELTKIIRASNVEPETRRERMDMEEAESRAQRTLLARSTGGGYGYDQDGSAQVPQWGVPDVNLSVELDSGKERLLQDRMGLEEAKAYLDSFTALQTWVLTLPDDPAIPMKSMPKFSGQDTTGISIASLARSAAGDEALPDKVLKAAEFLDEFGTNMIMPPSTKPELLAVTFALFVQTYCEIIEVGMESTAEAMLGSFRTIYEPLYAEELKDLDACRTTDDMVRLNSYNSQHLDCLSRLKSIMIQVANLQLKTEELKGDSNTVSSTSSQAKKNKLAEYHQHIAHLQAKYQEMAKQATIAFNKMKEYPFLRRARAVRWQLTLSSSSYALLAQFLSSRESLLPMSTLLQTKCEIQVERRDPLPYTPPCLLDDFVISSRKRHKSRNEEDVQWAAPIAANARAAETGNIVESDKLPFPRLYLDESYNSSKEAGQAKINVDFNRCLLVNGFRRLEALERKFENDSGMRKAEEAPPASIVSPLEPSVLLSTLCSSSSSGSGSRSGPSDISSIWEESGVGITCAKLCRPDGRRIAAGCDDSAVRIWSIFDPRKKGGDDDEVKETSIVFLGHKNGFPVFDVSWNRDGRTLLSAGGDGSVRLWDTMAVGPFGTLVKPKSRFAPSKPGDGVDKPDEQGMSIPGLKAETTEIISGAALAVYRGHAPSVPIWSVSSSPSGYYFATAAADATARIWVTDKPTPVRILSGHTNASVNAVEWHPNCNYVVTGCDDKTVRMWDVQSGHCVRLLTGGSCGINVVAVSPSGQFCSGADYAGVIHVWDLGSGKKVNEYRPPANLKRDRSGISNASMINSLCYSPCGSALAAGGDDCVVRIWDVRGAANHMGNSDYAEKQGWGESAPLANVALVQHANRMGMKEPNRSFKTRQTMLLDLQYTKRNLLLAVGKYTAPVPLISPIAD